MGLLLYHCSVKGWRDLQGAEFLLPWQQEKMQRYLHVEAQVRALVSGLLLNHVFGNELTAQIRHTEHGKPYFAVHEDERKYFSLSYANDYVVLAVGQEEMGVDVEKIVPYEHAMVQKCFTEEEQAWLKGRGNAQDFWQLWTAKESLMKAKGLGFALNPLSFSILGAQDIFCKDARALSVQFFGQTWFLQWIYALPQHVVCFASQAANNEISCVSILPQQLYAPL